MTRIGVSDDERSRSQAVLVSLDVTIDLSAPGASDSIDDTLDYAALTTEVATLVATGERRLLEHLAEQIAGHITAHEGVEGVTVEVAKESPPTVEDVGAIAVRIERPPR